jgi:phosphatidylserine/phosphatidylglycerophosphate/cardiolipin synthase-like enzyme
MAEKSLDLQYYIWENDTTGKILAAKLVKAAARGVHVRILIDDNNFQGRDFGTAALDQHPNIEVRVFNPFANRGMHLFDFMTDYARANQRMHNKVMVADGAVAVVGGRNIGDHYFGVNSEANFRDLDLAAVGPIVRDVAHSFDVYWNSEQAYPIAALHKKEYSKQDFEKIADDMRASLAEHPYPWPIDQEVDKLVQDIDHVVGSIVWATGRVVVDDPTRLASGRRRGREVVDRRVAAHGPARTADRVCVFRATRFGRQGTRRGRRSRRQGAGADELARVERRRGGARGLPEVPRRPAARWRRSLRAASRRRHGAAGVVGRGGTLDRRAAHEGDRARPDLDVRRQLQPRPRARRISTRRSG